MTLRPLSHDKYHLFSKVCIVRELGMARIKDTLKKFYLHLFEFKLSNVSHSATVKVIFNFLPSKSF